LPFSITFLYRFIRAIPTRKRGHERSSRGIDYLLAPPGRAGSRRLKLRDCLTILRAHYTKFFLRAHRYNIEHMEKFTVHTGLVVPLDRANVDTDAKKKKNKKKKKKKKQKKQKKKKKIQKKQESKEK
jgi:hypothetical protein